MSSVKSLPDLISISLAKGIVFRGYLAATMVILHAPILKFLTLCNSEERLEPSFSYVPERIPATSWLSYIQKGGEEGGELSPVKTLPVYTNNDNSLQQRQRLMTQACN